MKPAKYMKKKLNVDAIMNDLRGNSAFFPDYRRESSEVRKKELVAPSGQPAPPGVLIPTQGVPLSVPRPAPRSVPLIPKTKRAIKQRQPFDVYEDQYLTLKKIADAERNFVNGRGMSQMVREAIDAYFKAHNIPLEKLPK